MSKETEIKTEGLSGQGEESKEFLRGQLSILARLRSELSRGEIADNGKWITVDEKREKVHEKLSRYSASHPQGEQEDGGDELWNELGKDIYGGLSFKWYTEKLSALKAKYSLIKK